MNRKALFLILPLILLALSCRSLARPWHLYPEVGTATPSEIVITIGPTLTLTPTPSATSTATTSPTPLPSTTLTPTVVITPSAQQLRVFEELWQTVRDEYLYPDFNGLDWGAIHEEYQQRIESGLRDSDFYLAMDEMISRLGDDHSVFLSPEEVRQEDTEYAGNNDYVGVGVLIDAVPERDRAVILVSFPGSPAEQAGLQSRDNILRVNGQPLLDEDGFLRDIVRGPEGTQVTLTIQTPGEQPREVTLTRQHITGAVPIPYQVFTTPNGRRIGYIFLVTLKDSTIDKQVADALRDMTSEVSLDGLILDNRQNSGGADTVLRGVLSYFTNGTVGYLINQNANRALEVERDDINGSQNLPLVVLTDSGTVSYGEILSGILKDFGRAYLIGETTAGNVETLWGYDFEGGSRAWLAHESFRPVNHPEQNWEETGIIPDLTVISNWDEVSLQNDPVIQAGIDYLESLPSSSTQYFAPGNWLW